MMLDCVNVVKRYGGKFAVNGMSVAIEDAHIYGLLGPNGSGKSTWMKMAAGLIVPDEGQLVDERLSLTWTRTNIVWACFWLLGNQRKRWSWSLWARTKTRCITGMRTRPTTSPREAWKIS